MDYLKGEVDTAIQKDGSVTFTADQPMGTHKITGLAAPIASADAARKTDVDTVNAKLDDCSHAEPARSIDTIYQNGSKIRIVTISVSYDNTYQSRVLIGSGTPPTTQIIITDNEGAGTGMSMNFTFVVSPNWYYKLETMDGSPGVQEWQEWDLL